MKVLFIVLSLGFAVAAQNETTTVGPDNDLEPENIITNGYPAYEGKAPYIVSLALRRDGSNIITVCGASIIGHTWVLTAAHCINGQDYVDIHYGSNWRWRGQYSHRVRKNNFIQHHLWPNTNGNDIGLIRTPHVEFNHLVNKVNLPRMNQRNEQLVNWWTVACGWGGMANGQLAEWLQCMDIQVISNAECSRIYGTQPNGILCINTNGGKSTCGGDSGGPLVTHDNPMLVGVASWAYAGGCTAGFPAGFTRVTQHLDWIRQRTGISY